MTTDKQAVKVRLGDRHRAILDSLAIELGLSKNAVIEHLLDGANSVKATPVESIPVFYRDQILDARSKAYNQVFAQFDHKQILGSKTYYHHAGLKLICELNAKTKDTPQKLRVWLLFPNDELHINDDGTFLRYKGEQIEWFTKSEIAELEAMAVVKATTKKAKKAIEQPIAALKVDHKEIAIEAVIDAPTPSIEQVVEPTIKKAKVALAKPIPAVKRPKVETPTILTKEALKVKYDLTHDAYLVASSSYNASEGWLAPDGSTWFMVGTKKNRAWTSRPVALAETEAKVLSNA